MDMGERQHDGRTSRTNDVLLKAGIRSGRHRDLRISDALARASRPRAVYRHSPTGFKVVSEANSEKSLDPADGFILRTVDESVFL